MVSSFSELNQKELYRAALEDFAVDVKPTDSKKVIEAALLEAGVTWAMYLEGHPELAPAPAPVIEPVAVATNVVVSEQVAPRPVRTAEPEVRSAEDLYLVKMLRDNPYFEFGKYKFTKENPFVIMDADSTNAILEQEDGFAIAKPSEAREYYG